MTIVFYFYNEWGAFLFFYSVLFALLWVVFSIFMDIG